MTGCSPKRNLFLGLALQTSIEICLVAMGIIRRDLCRDMTYWFYRPVFSHGFDATSNLAGSLNSLFYNLMMHGKDKNFVLVEKLLS